MPTDDYCYVTTKGRRTGRSHRIEIWYARDGDTLYLLAGGGRRSDWVRNLDADPAIMVELGDNDWSATGSVITDEDESRRARRLVFDKYQPRYDGDLTNWRDRALPVAITLIR